jgi:hypothetical protein
MKSTIWLLATAISLPLAAERFCFENTGPKAKSVVTFDSERNRITDGMYKVTPTPEGKAKAARFHGTKSGTVYAITFKGKLPYKIPKGDDTVVWTRNGNNLEVPMYGKNTQTGKYAEYPAKFAPCKR